MPSKQRQVRVPSEIEDLARQNEELRPYEEVGAIDFATLVRTALLVLGGVAVRDAIKQAIVAGKPKTREKTTV